MSTRYVYSTLSADQIYTGYTAGGGDLPVAERSVFIKGGSNVADKRLITPRGVVTEITDEDHAFLKTVGVFNMHVDNGYITVSGSKEDPEKVVASEGLEARDQSAPLEPGDFDGQAGAQPILGDGEAEISQPVAPVSAPNGHPASKPAANPRKA